MANSYLKALEDRGHNPNLIVVSETVKRKECWVKDVLKTFNNTESNSDAFESKNRQYGQFQRMPLRMLVSQKASRLHVQNEEGGGYHSSNIQLSIPSCPYTMTEGISSYLPFQKRKLYNSASPSIRMFLQNPYVKKHSSPSQNSQPNGHNVRVSRHPSLNKTRNFKTIASKNYDCTNTFAPLNICLTNNVYQTEKQTKDEMKFVEDNTIFSFKNSCDFNEKSATQTSSDSGFYSMNNLGGNTVPLEYSSNENSNIEETLNSNDFPLTAFSSSLLLNSDSVEFTWKPVQCDSNITGDNASDDVEGYMEHFENIFSNSDN